MLFKKCQVVFAMLFAFIIPLKGLASQPVQTATRVHVFTPFSGATINKQLLRGKTIKGECLTHSLMSAGRPDAWRCQSNNEIQDPCFSSFGEPSLVCIKAPWDQKVVLLEAKPALDTDGPNVFDGKAMPWAIRLNNGNHCLLMTGATQLIAGMHVNYACADQGFLVGEIDKSQAQWTIFYSDDTTLFLEPHSIETVWY